VQYLFTTQNNAVTNTVFMGGFLGGRQLLGYAPDKRTLTLSGTGNNELSLAIGGSFTQSATASVATAETTGDTAVAGCGTLPQNAVVAAVAVSNPVIHLGSRSVSASSLLGAPVRRTVVSRAEGGGTGVATVQPNEYFFGTQYMYPTRFEVGSYTTTGANGGVVSVPYVVPRDFRVYNHGVQGKTQ